MEFQYNSQEWLSALSVHFTDSKKYSQFIKSTRTSLMYRSFLCLHDLFLFKFTDFGFVRLT